MIPTCIVRIPNSERDVVVLLLPTGVRGRPDFSPDAKELSLPFQLFLEDPSCREQNLEVNNNDIFQEKFF